MNKKEVKKRMFPVNFRRRYQERILRTVEREVGLPSTHLCMFIAELAKRISNGRLGCRQGMILVSDKGYENPLVTPHVWNTYEGKRFDLSPWSICPYPIEYVTEDDPHYEQWQKQGLPFGDGPADVFEEEMNRLVAAFHATSEEQSKSNHDEYFERLRDQVRAACSSQIEAVFC